MPYMQYNICSAIYAVYAVYVIYAVYVVYAIYAVCGRYKCSTIGIICSIIQNIKMNIYTNVIQYKCLCYTIIAETSSANNQTIV